jgi:ATP-dependent RNA helicase HelY
MTTAHAPEDASSSLVETFEGSYGFAFDDFQRRACNALASGASVLVAAPTGAGKTVVGEFAAWLALRSTGRTFYTTPIKALSNQKYADFAELHGAANVGLLTGDNSLNGDAPIVVMTTEVLRNMIYEDSPGLDSLHYVVLDEVHYLQDRYRGAVWEEVLIHLPVDVQTASLSATVSNAEEFAEWLQTLRGETEVIIEEQRPVEIRHWYFAADELLPMFVKQPDGSVIPNPRCREFDRRKRPWVRPERGAPRTGPRRGRIPRRTEVIDRLNGEGMLPCIYFIFSRRGCEDAVKQCMYENLRLTSGDERKRIVNFVEERMSDLPDDELDVLGYSEWLAGLSYGIAAHHAGMIPPFKETVEELFKSGLIKAVFATETLALGINMPARTVVIESLTKFTGEKHELMTAGQYTQLAGRAGRRGIDELGHSIVLFQRFTPFDTVTRLASTRTYPLNSSFQPSYNMAVNLVRTYDRHDAEHLVNSSFAQFQADRDVVALERSREKSEAYLASYREKMRCDRGDFEEYRFLLEELKASESSRSPRSAGAVNDALTALKPGDVIDVPGGKKRGRYVVFEVTARQSDHNPRVLAMTDQRTLVRFTANDFKSPPVPIGRLNLPQGFQPRDARARRHLARKLERLEMSDRSNGAEQAPARMSALQERLETHPCHACPDLGRHIHFSERARRLEKEVASLERRINRRTGTLARRFEQVLSVLEEMGYVSSWTLTPKGEVLTGIYNESDLLVVEALERELLTELDAAELAAVCSTLVYETRGPETGDFVPQLPTPASKQAWRRLLKLWRSIHDEEESRGLGLTREPDPGFADRAYRWASGAPLERVISEDDPPGDFVRNVKQLVDLLRQLEEVGAGTPITLKVREAIAGLHRGVVAYSSLEI